jgi:hypothetical protein
MLWLSPSLVVKLQWWILGQTGSVFYSPIMQWKYPALDMLAQLVQLDPKAQQELAMAHWMTSQMCLLSVLRMVMFYDIRKAWVFGLIATVSMVETFKGIDHANNTTHQEKV